MKKVLTALAVVLMIVGCATVKPAKKYPQLTGEHVKSTCKATDSWQIRVMPMPVIVIRFNEKGGCAGIKDLLLVYGDELAVLYRGDVCSNTTVTNDVIGHTNVSEAALHLAKIRALKA